MERSGKPALVNADEPPPQTEPYRCPGEQHPISRAVHLGRLAAFYPACRQCPRREETGTLSPRRVAQLAETSRRGQPRSLFHDEGAGGVYLNDLTPAAAKEYRRRVRRGGERCEEGRRESRRGERGREAEVGPTSPYLLISPSPQSPPSILLAGDGRPLTAELVAAAAEGLRSTGCDVVDVGPSTAPCLAFAVDHLQAAGGILVGNPGEDSHTAGMKFWAAGPRPLSAGGSLEPIMERYQAGVSRVRPTHRPVPAPHAPRPTPPLPGRPALSGPNGGILPCVAAAAGGGRFGVEADARFPAKTRGHGRLRDHPDAAARGTTCRGRFSPMRPTSPPASTATARRAACWTSRAAKSRPSGCCCCWP